MSVADACAHGRRNLAPAFFLFLRDILAFRLSVLLSRQTNSLSGLCGAGREAG